MTFRHIFKTEILSFRFIVNFHLRLSVRSLVLSPATLTCTRAPDQINGAPASLRGKMCANFI